MKDQKYKRGTLVRITFGHPIWSMENGERVTHDMSPEEVGKEAIIEYSYKERYGGSSEDSANSYSIVFLEDGNSTAWKQLSQIEYVSEGGEHLFEQAKANRDKIEKQQTDIGYILTQLEEGNLSSTSILCLFELIGFNSSFNRNGEFFALWNDWARLAPLFLHIKLSDSLEEANSLLTKEGLKTLNVEKVFNAFQEKS